MQVLLIGTDTLHRRFIINSLADEHDITACFYDGDLLLPKFDVKPNWAEMESKSLKDLFLIKTNSINAKKLFYVNSWEKVNNQLFKEIQIADIVLISGAGRIKGEFFNQIRDKAINIHLGIAEEYRGLDTNLWAWYHKDVDNIGVTLHEIDPTLDTGRIFFSEKLPMSCDIHPWNLRYHETIMAIKLINSALFLKQSKELVSRAQYRCGRYYSFMPAVLKNYLSPSLTEM